MRKYSWEQIQGIYRSLTKLELPAVGASVSVGKVYYDLVPRLWLDFLNGNPEDSDSMWVIYKEFARAMEDLRDWLVQEGHEYDHEMDDMNILSKGDFREKYPSELQNDARKLHSKMRSIVDEEKADIELSMADYISSEDIPPSWFTVIVTDLMASDAKGKPVYKTELRTPGVGLSSFWLSVILGSMVSSYKSGSPGRRCADPKCGKYFIPSSRSHGQLYHSGRCQNRHYYHLKKAGSQS